MVRYVLRGRNQGLEDSVVLVVHHHMHIILEPLVFVVCREKI